MGLGGHGWAKESLGKGSGVHWSLPNPAWFWDRLDSGEAAALIVAWFLQEAEPRMWTYVYPAKYSDIKTEDERWKEERDRKLKEERNRSKEAVSKEDGKESTSSECKLTPTEEARMVGKDPRPSVHVPVSSPLTQHQSYIPYMHGYSYSQSYDPNHPSYRAMPTVMMQNYPGRELRSCRRSFPGCPCSESEERPWDILSLLGAHVQSHVLLLCRPKTPRALTAFSPHPRIIPALQLLLLPIREQGIWQR